MTVDELLDQQAIRDVLIRYTRGIDRMDPDLVRSCYHPDAHDDHGAFRGGTEEFVAWFQEALSFFERTMHFVGNQLVEVDGDVARAESYCVAYHRRAADGDDAGVRSDHRSALLRPARAPRRRMAHRGPGVRDGLVAHRPRHRRVGVPTRSRPRPPRSPGSRLPRVMFGAHALPSRRERGAAFLIWADDTLRVATWRNADCWVWAR